MNSPAFPIRIAFLCEFPSLNGGERSLLATIDELGSKLACVAVAPPEGDLARALQSRLIPVIALPAKSVDDAPLADLLRQLPVDIIHANSLMMSRRLARLALRLPQTCTGHVRDIMKLSAQASAELHQIEQLICVSHDTANALHRQGVSTARTTVIHNGIDPNSYRRTSRTGAVQRELGIPTTSRLVLNVGQICLRKGQDVFARAAVQVARHVDDVHFLHAGQRYSSKSESIAFDECLDAVFAEAGLSHLWHRLGVREDIPQLLNEVDLLLHCARQEPLGRVLLEAAAMSTPIIATDVGGTREIIADGITGCLAPADDDATLARLAVNLLHQPTRGEQLGAAARQRCESRFSIQQSASQTMELWQQQLALGKLRV